MAELDVAIVTYHPDRALLQQLVASLAQPARGPWRLNLLLQDNGADVEAVEEIRRIVAVASRGAFARIDIAQSPGNVGFGRGVNAAAARGTAPFVLVLNQDCVLEPGALDELMATAVGAPDDVAAWEMRQVPYEHPKAYDPVTLETPWVSGAAVLLRRPAFEAVHGFDPRIFMYAEDVDLSWRLRAAGWRLTYQPRCAVVHRTYREAAEVKPLQVFGGVQSNLCLRARFGGVVRTLQGLAMLAGEIAARPSFPGRRWGLAKAGMKFLARWPAFAATRVPATARFQPHFAGWGFETRREGAFVPLRSAREPRASTPKVSILIRTIGRTAWLTQALASCAHQTWRNLEVVVIEDGPERSRDVVETFRDRLDIRYRATGHAVGRARAGNLALASATGEWLNFLDDDDVLFADHVEALVDAVQASNAAGAYGLAWETHTAIHDRSSAAYDEVLHVTRHRQRFDRLILWHHNYLPIQAVLFHRRLYERYGGFEEDMDQLEDWNLWTRYTLEEEFIQVEKTTSKYRVPAEARVAAERQAQLDRAYAQALERQRAMQLTLSPRTLAEMAEAYARNEALMMLTRNDVRRFVVRHGWLARIAAFRHPIAVAARRLTGAR
jgi:GT2 family glycosyltransferase